MQIASQLIEHISGGGLDHVFAYLYPQGEKERQAQRYIDAIKGFIDLYGDRPVGLYSAPGRTEVGGNHTDHQYGRVLAAAVNLDVLCVAAKNEDNIIRIKSKGYDEDQVDAGDLAVKDAEKNSAISLIRGVAAGCKSQGFAVGGFDAYTTSDVLKGSGLSSSAAFEVAVGTMISHLFNDGAIGAVKVAQISQFAENEYFGKPSGLMDQMASSVGGFVAIDFKDNDNPVIQPVAFDLTTYGYTLCIVDTKGNHADLTHEYAAIPVEMKKVAALFSAERLREVDESAFYSRLPEIREKCGDRAALRAMHFFSDNSRVPLQVKALQEGNFETFKELIIASGRSSFTCLQNVFACSEPQEQGLSVALAISERILGGKGAWRVHGGGFAGTIQAFVPDDALAEYKNAMESLFGEGSCYQLSIRPVGGVDLLALKK